MFIITEILIPRSRGSNLDPVAIDTLEDSFEKLIKLATFAFPYSPDKFQYVVNVREEQGSEIFLLIVNPELKPDEEQLFVTVIDDIPVVKKYNLLIHRNLKILGTIAHASKVSTVVI